VQVFVSNLHLELMLECFKRFGTDGIGNLLETTENATADCSAITRRKWVFSARRSRASTGSALWPKRTFSPIEA
jgi:hypothetical protein